MGNHDYMSQKRNEINIARERNIDLSSEEIDNEMKFWETIKNCNYSQKSDLFRKNIDIDEILKQLNEAKLNKKDVYFFNASAFCIYYLSEEEKRKIEEERKKREEERKKIEEERKREEERRISGTN